MTSRRTFLGLAGAAGAAALAGCSSDPEVDPALGPPATPDTEDEITFGIWDKAQEPAMIEIVDAFQQHFPGIGVSISTTAFGPYFEPLRIQAQGDNLPDVFWINGPNFELYASHEMLQDLSELEGFDPANYPPNLVELYSFESSAFGTFLMRQHYLGMPRSLEEAARLDGASPWQTFWRIMFPLSGPALSAVAILTALASWNDLMWPLIVATYDDRTTLAVGLSSLQGQFTTDYPVMMAASFMAMLPLMILFIVLQRRVIEGLAHSGMKG